MTHPDPCLSLDAGPPRRQPQTSWRILTTTLLRVKHIPSSQRNQPHSCRIPKRPPRIRRHGRTGEAPKHRLSPVVHLPLPRAPLSLSFHWRYPNSLRANGGINRGAFEVVRGTGYSSRDMQQTAFFASDWTGLRYAQAIGNPGTMMTECPISKSIVT